MRPTTMIRGELLAGVGGQPPILQVAAEGAAEPGVAVARMFPGDERCLHEARAWAAQVAGPCRVREDVMTIVSELAANAIRHTRTGQHGMFTVEIIRCREVLRVAVSDDGGPGEPCVIDDPEAEHGRGLLLVRGLSSRMDVAGDHRGRIVWADLPLGSQQAVEHARDLLTRTVNLSPSVPQPALMHALREYRAALHALVVSQHPPR